MATLLEQIEEYIQPLTDKIAFTNAVEFTVTQLSNGLPVHIHVAIKKNELKFWAFENGVAPTTSKAPIIIIYAQNNWPLSRINQDHYDNLIEVLLYHINKVFEVVEWHVAN